MESNLLSIIYLIIQNVIINFKYLTKLGVFIPLILFILLKQTPKINVVISICLAFMGICLLSLNQQLRFNKGDLLCILCSLAFAVHIIATGILTRGVDSVSLGVLQLGFVGVYSMIFSFIFENPKLPSTNQSWFTVLALSIFCTAIAFIVQTVAQKDTTSTHTGLIFSLEPVFAAILAFIFAGEILSIRGYLGAVILIFSILLVEFDFKYKFKNLKDINYS